MDRPILDVCCGSRMFHFDKGNSRVLFADIRSEVAKLSDDRSIHIEPDVLHDCTKMFFDDESFYHVVFDPPHLVKLGINSDMAKKYGVLKRDWKPFILDSFNECMRVLKTNGTLIFKWNEYDIPIKEILELLPVKPIYGHTSGRQSKTIWMCFYKF